MVRYLEAAGQLTPELKLRSLQVLRVGFQKLLSFQNRDGGFGWFAGQRSDPFLTAYGLMQLAEMAQLIDIDPAVLARVRASLLRALKGNKNNNLLAYGVWALSRTGTNDRESLDRLESLCSRSQTPYFQALALQSLLTERPDSSTTARLLGSVAASVVTENRQSHWLSHGRTLSRGYGTTSSIEVTALAVMALMRGRSSTNLAQSATNWLIARRNSRGLWGSTQSTVLTLMALIEASGQPKKIPKTTRVTIQVNGKETGNPLSITPDQSDVVHTLELTDWAKTGGNEVALRPNQDDLPMTYSLVWQYYRPWRDEDESSKPLTVTVRYDQQRVRRGAVLTATAQLTYRDKKESGMVILDIGIPAGFSAIRQTLEKLRQERQIARFTIQPRQVTLYIMRLYPGQARYRIGFRARNRVRAKAPPTEAYEYYRPATRDRAEPTLVEVY